MAYLPSYSSNCISEIHAFKPIIIQKAGVLKAIADLIECTLEAKS